MRFLLLLLSIFVTRSAFWCGNRPIRYAFFRHSFRAVAFFFLPHHFALHIERIGFVRGKQSNAGRLVGLDCFVTTDEIVVNRKIVFGKVFPFAHCSQGDFHARLVCCCAWLGHDSYTVVIYMITLNIPMPFKKKVSLLFAWSVYRCVYVALDFV